MPFLYQGKKQQIKKINTSPSKSEVAADVFGGKLDFKLEPDLKFEFETFDPKGFEKFPFPSGRLECFSIITVFFP